MITETVEEKKTSWVELYFDLIFVLAIAQVAHMIASGSRWTVVWPALGLFAVLWWTWIGFALFYNRFGDENVLWQRLALVVATVPCGLAAIAVYEIAHGERTAFTLSLAGVRVVLAVVNLMRGGVLPRKIAAGYGVAAVLILASIPLDQPWWWLLWAAAIVVESLFVFAAGPSRKLSSADKKLMWGDWRKSLRLMKPTDPAYALNVPHLAERFGLFMIIVLGEVLVSAGRGALSGGHVPWWPLAGVLVLSGALWWVSFDSAAQNNERLLEMAGGSPQMARSMFAFGRMIPAFALVVIAAGLTLLLEGHATMAAYWFVSAGLGVYLLGTRADVGTSPGSWFRLALAFLAFPLGLLGAVVSPAVFIWVVCGWTVVCAVAATLGGRELKTVLSAEAG